MWPCRRRGDVSQDCHCNWVLVLLEPPRTRSQPRPCHGGGGASTWASRQCYSIATNHGCTCAAIPLV
ncbi:hypothetical protein GUJ93_ZPchr0079g2782 [Zizania palustris]|uniref:Uncharacterized protein n=1 Tax=Zizania palustris TaxID=103762 RepID=A0A8J5UVH3_ZIZPA|nr:hypothetical protein GUJ93_ZPchr0079g2782 [Zizania palustris]